jgi:hypothetical protein
MTDDKVVISADVKSDRSLATARMEWAGRSLAVLHRWQIKTTEARLHRRTVESHGGSIAYEEAYVWAIF